MAKASSPVRLDAELMKEAVKNGRLFNRSAAETIEYWAGLGKKLYKLIDPEVLLEIQAGSLQLDVKPANVAKIDPVSVFGQIEERRASKTLNQFVHRDQAVYQASQLHPGLLEQIMPDGTMRLGRFQSGEFHADKA